MRTGCHHHNYMNCLVWVTSPILIKYYHLQNIVVWIHRQHFCFQYSFKRMMAWSIAIRATIFIPKIPIICQQNTILNNMPINHVTNAEKWHQICIEPKLKRRQRHNFYKMSSYLIITLVHKLCTTQNCRNVLILVLKLTRPFQLDLMFFFFNAKNWRKATKYFGARL